MKRIYLDYAATTPTDKAVVKAMLPFFTEKYGNPSSLHSFGQEAEQALEDSRNSIASFLKARPEEIIFTGSATESNNMALKGIAFANKNKGKHIITSEIEHDCILESSKWLEKQGFDITRIKPDKYGLISPEDVKKAIRKDTILVSIMHANNEIGTIQPIEEIARVCKENKIYFHTDAAQSFGKIPINMENIDLLTASSHKMYGPRGAALLYIKEGTNIEPLLHGGGHEYGLRSSTVNIPAIVGFAKAVKICYNEMEKESKRQIKLRDKLIKEIAKIPNAYLNGHIKERLPNNINFRFDFVEGEAIIMKLDTYGIAASTGSACSSPKLEPSHVLLALGIRHEQAHGSLRISIGRYTKEEDIDYLLKILTKTIKELRDLSPFGK